MSLPHCLFHHPYFSCERPFHNFHLRWAVWMTTLSTKLAHSSCHLTVHNWLVFYKIPMCLTKIDYVNCVLYLNRPTEAVKAKLKPTNKTLSLLLLSWISSGADMYYYFSVSIENLFIQSKSVIVDKNNWKNKIKRPGENLMESRLRFSFPYYTPHFSIGIRCTWDQLCATRFFETIFCTFYIHSHWYSH